MTKSEFFKIVPARQFFTQYAPQVKRYYHKMRGIDGNGQPLEFSPEDRKVMKEAVKKLSNEIKNVDF